MHVLSLYSIQADNTVSANFEIALHLNTLNISTA